MSKLGYISLRRWRMSRGPYAFLVLLACLLILLGATTPAAGFAYFFAILIIFALPFIGTLRFQDMGRYIFWPLLPLPGLLFLGGASFFAAAAVSGAPRSGADPLPPSVADLAMVFGALACIVLFVLTTIAGMIHPSKAEEDHA